jgi:N-acetylmuramoyl-L-alanine amidase
MISDYARVLIKIMVWREMQNVPEAWKAVVHVVLNRAAKGGWWGHDIVTVVTHPYQFSGMTAPGEPPLTHWPQENGLWIELGKAVDDVLDAGDPDPSAGATFYFSLPLTQPPLVWGSVAKTWEVRGVQFFRQAESPSSPPTT